MTSVGVVLGPILSFYLRLCRSTALARFNEINFTVVVSIFQIHCTIERHFGRKRITMDNDIKPTVHGTISSTGLIQFHDRTEQQGNSLIQLHIYLVF